MILSGNTKKISRSGVINDIQAPAITKAMALLDMGFHGELLSVTPRKPANVVFLAVAGSGWAPDTWTASRSPSKVSGEDEYLGR
jgi:hypothetical protein